MSLKHFVVGSNPIARAMSKQITEKQILLIADEHIKRFTRWITLPHSGVNVAECRAYLAIWESVKAKSGKGLTPEEEGELMDAIESGGYDELLSPGTTYIQRRCAAEDVPFLTEGDV